MVREMSTRGHPSSDPANRALSHATACVLHQGGRGGPCDPPVQVRTAPSSAVLPALGGAGADHWGAPHTGIYQWTVARYLHRRAVPPAHDTRAAGRPAQSPCSAHILQQTSSAIYQGLLQVRRRSQLGGHCLRCFADSIDHAHADGCGMRRRSLGKSRGQTSGRRSRQRPGTSDTRRLPYERQSAPS